MTAYYRKSDFRENKYMKEFNDGSGGYVAFQENNTVIY